MTARARTVRNTLLMPDDSPWVGKEVKIRLSVPVFAEGGTVEKISVSKPITDDTGTWSCALEVNDDLDPAGTYYTVTEGPGRTWTIVVQASDPDPVQLRACLQVVPSNPTPIVAPTAAELLAAMFANVVTA